VAVATSKSFPFKKSFNIIPFNHQSIPSPIFETNHPYSSGLTFIFNGAWVSSNGEPRLPQATHPIKYHILGFEKYFFEFSRIEVPPAGHLNIIKFKRPQKYLNCHIDNNIFSQLKTMCKVAKKIRISRQKLDKTHLFSAA
jgi:hypothetical protein